MSRTQYTPAQLAKWKRYIDAHREKKVELLAKRLGIGHELVRAIRDDAVELYRERLRERRRINVESEGFGQPRDAHYTRCPECGGLVLMPCIACGMEREKKAKVRR